MLRTELEYVVLRGRTGSDPIFGSVVQGLREYGDWMYRTEICQFNPWSPEQENRYPHSYVFHLLECCEA